MKSMLLMVTAASLVVGSAVAADKPNVCDPGPDKRLSASELEQCFLANDPTLAKMLKDRVPPSEKAKVEAKDLADDALNGAQDISIEDANAYLRQRVENTREQTDIHLGWSSLDFGRELTDTANPRQQKYPAAFILSYSDNREGGDDSFVALGDINWFSTYAADIQFNIASSIDVATKKPPADSSIDVSTSASRLWNFPKSAWLSDVALVLEPKYTTDRDFRRDVVEISAKVIPSSPRFLRAGYNTPLGGDLSLGAVDDYLLYWQPVVGFEFGSINDAGGNESLMALQSQGAYKRAAASVGVKLAWPVRIPMSLNASYTYRWDLDEHWNRGFLATGLQYDVAKNFAVTLIYRNGRKPDTFEDTEEILLGFGLMQSK